MSVLRRLLNLWRGRTLSREFDDELQFHAEMRIEANLRAGMSRADAEAETRRHMNSALRAKEGMREARISRRLDAFGCDVRQAARLLCRQPGIAVLAVLTLALGIGANTAIFSVVNGVLIKPLPYPNPDELVRIVHTIGGINQPYFSDGIFVTYLDNNQTFQDIGVWGPDATANITGSGEAEEVRALPVTAGFLTTLGVQPEMGRWFSQEDLEPKAPDVVILTSGYWLRKFGGDPTVLQHTLTVNSTPHRIIGVMPPEFRFGESEIVVPLRINRGRLTPAFRLLGVARLKPGVTLAQANTDVARMLEIWFDNFEVNTRRDVKYVPSLLPLKQDVVGDIGKTLGVLMGTIGVVLLMACANVANLLLVRADARRDEFAIRAALGAQWSRVARTLLIEGMMLAILGGALALSIAFAGLRVLVALGPSNLPRLSEVSIDAVVLAFTFAVSLFSGLVFSVIPILKYAGPQRAASLAMRTRGASLSRARQRSQNVLVAAQMALALILLVSSGLMIRSFQALRSVSPGFMQPHRVLTFSISIPGTEVTGPDEVSRIQQEIVERIAAIPGVTSAGFATRLPMDPNNRFSSAILARDKSENRPAPPNRHVKLVSPGMFQTLQTPRIAGRDFTWTDVHERREVAIVSENFAVEMWGSAGAALGKQIREFYSETSPWREIVGVVADVYDDGAHRPAPTTIYWPTQLTAQSFGIPKYQPRRISVAVRTEQAHTESLLNEIIEVVGEVRANLPLARVRTLGDIYDQSMSRTSFTLVMLAIACTMALLLGISGLFAVLSYAVSQRRREIGIRIALGAPAGEIRSLFIKRGLLLTSIGGAIGLGVAAFGTRLMQSVLFGISPLDPVTFAAVPIVLMLVAVLASYLPARRAMAVDPVETLKTE